MSLARKYRVLLIDNDPAVKHSFERVFDVYSEIVMDFVSSHRDATLLIDYHAYDIVFASTELAQENGIDITEYISRSFLNQSTPVILLSYGVESTDNLTKKNEGDDYGILRKPIVENELKQIVIVFLRVLEKEKKIEQTLNLETNRRKQIETELKKSRESFDNIVDRSNAGIIIVDGEGTIQFTNKAAEQIFLRNKEELVGRPFGVIADYKKRSEIDIIRKNGEVGTGELSVARTQWKGQPASLLLINDITKHKKLQQSLDEALLKSMESDRLKTAFLANMSHEIRTPLNGILGFSELLNTQTIDRDTQQSYLRTINDCGLHLLRIINDIIDIAQIESGQMQISVLDFDLISLMKEVKAMYRNNKIIVQKKLELKLLLPSVNELYIVSDPVRIRQILINLIDNAIKFTDKGQITIGFEILEDSTYCFYVRDTGIGIPEKKFPLLFERFRQLEPAEERINEGNGLGLSISKALVELLGGSICPSSKPGAGSTFYFTIRAVSTEKKKNGEVARSISTLRLPALRNKKVLIAEDEETNFLLLQSLIKEYEPLILWAMDGASAVEIATREDIDIVLMDLKIPVMSGFEAIKEIRKVKPDVPVIAQTAYAMAGDKEKILASGFNDYISKPIVPEELLNKLEQFMKMNPKDDQPRQE